MQTTKKHLGSVKERRAVSLLKSLSLGLSMAALHTVTPTILTSQQLDLMRKDGSESLMPTTRSTKGLPLGTKT